MKAIILKIYKLLILPLFWPFILVMWIADGFSFRYFGLNDFLNSPFHKYKQVLTIGTFIMLEFNLLILLFILWIVK